jgi:hypothetical protein
LSVEIATVFSQLEFCQNATIQQRKRYQDARFRRRLGRRVNTLEQLTVDVAAGRLNIIEGQRVSAGLATSGETGVHDLSPWFGTSVWMTGLD